MNTEKREAMKVVGSERVMKMYSLWQYPILALLTSQ
jgi:hypothetical protein